MPTWWPSALPASTACSSRPDASATFNGSPSKKGTGFQQPLKAHEHWHVDVSYINISGTFYYLASVLDGMSRSIVHFEIHESMTEPQIELIIQRAREKFPDARPRIISDNGPQFIANDFKQFIRLCGMTHVRTSPFYPQSNGKLERFHKTIKSECIRPKTPLSLDDARRLVAEYVEHYNNVRLHTRHRLRHPGRQACRAGKGDLREARPQARRGPRGTRPTPPGASPPLHRRVPATAAVSTAAIARSRKFGLATSQDHANNPHQPAKRKRAPEASVSPGIAGRVCDE